VHCTTWQRAGFQRDSDSASAHALRQPTSCRSEYFYNQIHKLDLIGTERSGIRNTEVFPIDLNLIMKVDISDIWKLRVRVFQ